MAKWCLDGGHGGRDSGAVGLHGRLEKTIVLAAVLRAKEVLEGVGEEVILTRAEDSWMSLEDRTRLANESGCNYFISIHMNSATNRSAVGVEVWVARERSSTSDKLADTVLPVVLNEVNKFGYESPNRGKKAENFWVLRYSNMPAILVEGDFISNGIVEDKFIAEKYGEAIAKGCLKFIGKEPGVSIPVEEKPPVVETPYIPREVTFLNPSKYCEWVSRLQSELNRQGYGFIGVDGYVGNNTLRAVSKCPISYSCSGNITKLLQEILQVLGVYNGNLDGSCGPQMISAIKKWQSVAGLSIDGSFGPACWRKLFGM